MLAALPHLDKDMMRRSVLSALLSSAASAVPQQGVALHVPGLGLPRVLEDTLTVSQVWNPPHRQSRLWRARGIRTCTERGAQLADCSPP